MQNARNPNEPNQRERFEASVLVHLDAAYNLARWLLRDADAADDVVQDASLRAFRFFDAMQGPTPRAWFMAIVRNACLDWIGMKKRRGVEECYDEAVHGGSVLDAADDASPESIVVRASAARELHACISRLPREYREVLILREMEELSYREISAVVEVPIGTVMSRLSRGRNQLARLMRAPEQRRSS
ncbi:MAG: sigma-70 family RNA polymerase sigma factor [Proteobacteria bacterium]|nr:sigma-70 family RNA polymerase sigma factor [Burkholderiales bacterium]